MPFEFRRLGIPDLVLIGSKRFGDARGFFQEAWHKGAFEAAGIPGPFVQINWSRSRKGALRGLHFQKPPKAQGKLLMVLKGEIYDVAVDIRKGSPTYGKWEAVTLSEAKGEMLYVPPGFAHGFCVTSEEVDVLYQVTADYAPDLDRGILWNDLALSIPWPEARPELSPKDAKLPLLRDADNPF